MSFDRLQHIIIFFNRQILWPFRLETCSNSVVAIATFGHERWMFAPFTVCCFGTISTCISLTASHREHHIATNPDQHSFMVIKMAYTFCFNNSLQLLYSKCSLWNIVWKNDVYKIPEVLFISLTLNWHKRKKKINQYVPHILDG